jgi:hypothetical protein
MHGTTGPHVLGHLTVLSEVTAVTLVAVSTAATIPKTLQVVVEVVVVVVVVMIRKRRRKIISMRLILQPELRVHIRHCSYYS